MLDLYVGNKNYSSWSLRGWLLLRGLDIPFEEHALELFTEDFARRLTALGAPARVPVLVDDGQVVWDTMAIAEYVAERFPDRAVWPRDRALRALARSFCAEMHSSFQALRTAMPMNVEADLPGGLWSNAVRDDILRVLAIWYQALALSERANRPGGPFLFGEFGAVDAFFAPVISRFATYRVELPEPCATYARTVLDPRRSSE
ncbi:MAG: glutathione S-transferase [Burkholderiaceae bacterium]